jgi:uncharacterized protein YciI
MKTLMFYDLDDQGLAKVPTLYPAHCERLQAFMERGVLLMAGPYGIPPQGALAVFTTDEAALEFIQGDPFVLGGVVSRWHIHRWDTVG